MSRPQTTLYTAKQTKALLKAWAQEDELPKKGVKRIIVWPIKEAAEADVAEILRANSKSETGEQLYAVTMSSTAGRAFDDTVQEAHVGMFRHHRAQIRRAEKRLKLSEALALCER